MQNQPKRLKEGECQRGTKRFEKKNCTTRESRRAKRQTEWHTDRADDKKENPPGRAQLLTNLRLRNRSPGQKNERARTKTKSKRNETDVSE